MLQAEDLLEDSEVLQGFRCPVAELFRTDPGGILDLILDLLGWVVRRDHLHGQIRGQVEKARRAIVQALARPVGPIGPPDSVRALSVEKPDSTTTRPRPVLRAYSLRTKSVLLATSPCSKPGGVKGTSSKRPWSPSLSKSSPV